MFIYIILLASMLLLKSSVRNFFVSLYMCIKNPKKAFDDFYGMVGYLGYYGQGKTLAMTDTINKYKKLAQKHKVNLKVFTNFNYAFENGSINSFSDIEKLIQQQMKEDDKNTYLLFSLDELQNCLNSRNWNDTKKMESLLAIFTQTRKLRCMFLYTSPTMGQADKNIRISSRSVYVCKKINRFYFVRWKLNPIQLEGNLKELELPIIPTQHTLLNKELQNSYNTFAFIKTISKQEYLKEETIKIIN